MTSLLSVNWPSECVVIIPCLNEARRIAPLVTEVRLHLPRVYVIDDGSTDETGRLAELAGATVLRHSQTSGKGTALQTGLRRAHADGFAWALLMDGDGQHAPADIARFLRTAENTQCRLVVGNRMADPRGMPWVRRLVNWWMSRKLSKLAGCRMPDTQCGFRLLQLKAWAAVSITARHFEVESEMLLAFARAGFKPQFVPVQSIYGAERSKINPLQDTWRWFRWRLHDEH